MTRQIAKFLCGNAELVTLREEVFRQDLIKIGCHPENLETWADPAFGLEPVAGTAKGRKILKNEGIELKKDKLVGICFRHAYWAWDDQTYRGFAQKIAAMCDFMVEKFEAEILFTPNCTYNVDDPHEDDRLTCDFVRSFMKYKADAYLIQTDLQLPDRLTLYNLLDLVVSNRRHVSTGAATHGIPFVSMSTGHMWQFKPFMERLDMDLNQLINFVDEDLDTIKRKLVYVWTNGEKISRKNSAAIVPLREIAKKQVFKIADLVNS
jgi:polysaccharide pyruvyl transferase WcaK-like protein